MNMDATTNNKLSLENYSNVVLLKLTRKDKYKSNQGRVNYSTINKDESPKPSKAYENYEKHHRYQKFFF